jgi:glycerol-3-phosphate acyltransferase PlsX
MLKRWFADQKSEGLREWVEKFMELKSCNSCEGQRLKKESCWFKVDNKNIAELSNLNLDKLHHWFVGVEKRLDKKQNVIAKDILKEIRERVQFLLDVGLNADCKPELLNQFAILGRLYAEHILGIKTPTVGLVNVGEEEGKGNILAQATYPLLKENHQIKFVGNIEGRDFFNEKADVMVCDGFTGNIVLKMAESFYDLAKQRGLGNDEYLSRFHYENYGGTPVLGVAKPVIIGHGISSAKAFSNMISLAEKMITTNICTKMVDSFQAS